MVFPGSCFSIFSLRLFSVSRTLLIDSGTWTCWSIQGTGSTSSRAIGCAYLQTLFCPRLHSRRALPLQSQAISFLRSFLDRRGFTEVETPVLWPSVGGASARPFTTRSQALHASLFMRI